MPTGILLIKQLQVPTEQDLYHTNFFGVDDMSEVAAWVALTLNIPFWLGVYYYLDCVMPNSYGIQLHPCFCL